MLTLNCNFKEILLDEIALDGLEGVTLSNLWIHVAQRLALSNPISEVLKNRFWNTLVTFDCLSFYALPEDVPDIKTWDRFSYIDPHIGVLYEPDEPINEFQLYPPIPNEYGLCKYKKRRKVSHDEIKSMTYEDVVEKWNKSLVIVASFEERWKALVGHISTTYVRFLQPVHYILLELIGKSRNNGQTTVGRNALSKITPNSKLLFYQRNLLIKLGLIMKYRITFCPYLGAQVQQSLLLRLVRYHRGQLIPPPNVGLLHNAIEILKRKPDQRELVSKLRDELGLSCKQFQKLYRRVDVQKYLKMDENPDKSPTKPDNPNQSKMKTRKLSGSDEEEEPKAKIAKVNLPPRYVMLRAEEDLAQSSESEDESKDSSSSMKTDYRLGVPLLRQALQKIRKAGERGLTQINLSKLLGTDPYATRGLCRQLTTSKCVEEFLEDKGRQRTTRYICCKQSVDANVSLQYEKEKDKLISHMQATETSLKKRKKKLPPKENVQINEFNSFQYNLSDIVEVTHFTGIRDNTSSFIESLKNSKNLTSLKQLKLANCILNIIKEKPIVIGFNGLNTGLRKSGHFETIDSKSLKRCALRLADDGQLRMYKVKWPSIKEHYTLLICAPGISKEDPIIGSIYNDICLRSFRSKITRTTQPSTTIINDVCKYPKYVRVRILHEILFSFAYGNDVKNNKTNLPQGWVSLVQVIPHLTFGFIMSHLTFVTEKLNTFLKDRSILEKKINTLPIEVVKTLFETNKTVLSIKRAVKCLGTLGLVQFTEEAYSKFHHSGDSNHLELFVNHHATLVNTKGTITDDGDSNLERDKITFYFKTGNDLKDFWKCFKDIALNTVVELENRTVLECKGKIASYEGAAGQDDGSVPGDGLGVAGYHSAYFIELFRQWCIQDKVPIKRKLLELREKPPIGHCPRKKPCLPRKPEPVKKATKKMVRLKKKSKQVTVMKPKAEAVKPKKFTTRTKLRWLPWEDDLIIMARTVRYISTCGNNIMGASACAKICKFILKTISNDSNKSVVICHRRGVKLDKSLIYASEREKYLAEVHRRPSLRSHYEGIYQRLKPQYKDDQLFSNALDLKISELLLVLMKLPMRNSGKHCIAAAAKSTHELKQKYYIRKSHQENVFPYGKDCDALVNTLMDAVHMILHFNPKFKSPNEIFKVFVKYEELTLRTATNNLYDIKLIARTKKADNTSKLIEESGKICHDFHFHLSHRYKIQMHDRLPQKHFDDMVNTLRTTDSNATSLSSANFNCALFELLPSEAVSLSMKLRNALSNEFTVIDKTPFNKIAICEVKWHLKCDLADVLSAVNEDVLKDTLKEMERKSVFPKLAPFQAKIENERLAYVLTENEEQGANIDDLLRKCSGDLTLPTLKEYLKDLEEKCIIINIGLEEPKWVLNKFSDNWLLKVGELRLKPKPWLQLNGTLNKEAFVKISQTILLWTIELPGLSVYNLAKSLKFLRIAHVRELCEMLEKLGCVTLKHLILRQSNVFDDDYEEEDICIEESCFTNDPKNLYVFPTYNATVLFSVVKTLIKKYE